MRKTEDLRKRYDKVCDDYILEFCLKQDLDFEFWVNDTIGGLACFGDIYFFPFGDIVWDINSYQPKGLIMQHTEDFLDNPTKQINYYSYTKGLRFKDIKE